MDGHTMEQVRELLLQRWKKIERSSQRDGAPVDEVLPQAEMIDMAQSLEQIGRDTSLKEQERRELLAIERALSKLASGAFGTCEDCGEEIPSKRLLVLPEARLCANCQAFEERQNARMRSSGAAAR
jgi:DnaK suppressor protein